MKVDLDLITDDADEVAELEEFIGHLINGVSTTDAITRVWPDRRKPVHQYVADIDGLLVGWAMCGKCNKHVSRCTCEDGPTEPPYIGRLRAAEARHKALAGGADQLTAERAGEQARTSVSTGSAGASGTIGGADVAESSTSTSEGDAPSLSSSPGLVPCKPGKHLVPVDTAEQNDDGSWTCFDHQAGAAVDDASGAVDE